MTRVVALGDSFTCGEGVGVLTPANRTWSALLAAALPASRYTCLAQPGARARDVLATQVPAAAAARPDLATLLVGLNDVCRAGFDAHAVANVIRTMVDELQRTGAQVVVGRLHDPAALLPLPARLRERTRHRVAAVNAAIPADVPVLDLQQVPDLQRRSGWAVDRLHPSHLGHAAMARAAAGLLGDGIAALIPAPSAHQAPGLIREAAWLLRHGLPYLATHGRQVLTPAVTGCG